MYYVLYEHFGESKINGDILNLRDVLQIKWLLIYYSYFIEIEYIYDILNLILV